MSKVQIFNGRAGSFGNPRYYVKSHPASVKGYHAKVCSVEGCGKVALYRVASSGYCKSHKELAIIRRSKYVVYLDKAQTDIARVVDSIENRLKLADKTRARRGYRRK